MKKKIHFLLGVGEVGSALKKILEKDTELYWFDSNPKIKNRPLPPNTEVDVLHIAVPYSRDFLKTVKKYAKDQKAKLIVNHSTMVLGTTQKLGEKAAHSPILGQHDNLYKHIKTFKKAIGPNSSKAKRLAQTYLKDFFDLEFFADSKTTELAKLISLARFAAQIDFTKYADRLSQKADVEFDQAYTQFSNLYNEGYRKLKLEQFIQPVLYPPRGPIGGSCVIPGVEKILGILPNKALQDILKKNGKKS